MKAGREFLCKLFYVVERKWFISSIGLIKNKLAEEGELSALKHTEIRQEIKVRAQGFKFVSNGLKVFHPMSVSRSNQNSLVTIRHNLLT